MNSRHSLGEPRAAAVPRWGVPFLDAVSRVQSLVSNQASPEVIYQAVVDGVAELLQADSSNLRFLDPDDAEWMVSVATHGVTGPAERWRHRARINEGVSGRVISSGEMVLVQDLQLENAVSRLAPVGTKVGIGIPIRERGEVIGALVAGSRQRVWRRDDEELLRAYAEHVEVALSVARAAHRELEAFTDALTGLGNRALMLDRLARRLARAGGGGGDVTVLFLDLDRFKLVNDSLGHIAGDQLLSEVAERLARCVRDGDVCARLGADEFAVLLAAGSDADAVTQRIIEALECRFEVAGHEVFVGVSVGIASGREPGETLLRNADVAMYHAKQAGAGRYARFDPSMHAARVSRLGLDAELRRAVERQEFELHFQPLFHLGSGTVAAFESLVRWRHPVRGLVAPGEFIPVAEETGLIVEIDRWVREAACRQLAAWWRKAPLAMSFNASMRDLQQPDFAAAVERAIGGACPPSALILEVTESARLEDAPGALASLHAVKELGVRVALDDFGTGYSSLLSLSQLPVDLLKVALPFVQAAVGDNPKGRGLLAGMIALGRHLGLTTVAEGIETPEQRDLLLELGCDLGQGYLLGRPLEAPAAEALIRSAGVAAADALEARLPPASAAP